MDSERNSFQQIKRRKSSDAREPLSGEKNGRRGFSAFLRHGMKKKETLGREGCPLDEVAFRTQLDPVEVDELHQLYIRQTNQLTIPGDLVLELESMRFDVRKNPARFVETVRRMVRIIRNEPGAVARVDVTVEPVSEADSTDAEPESGSNKGSSNS